MPYRKTAKKLRSMANALYSKAEVHDNDKFRKKADCYNHWANAVDLGVPINTEEMMLVREAFSNEKFEEATDYLLLIIEETQKREGLGKLMK